MADYMKSFMWQSCCGERAGSHINAVKTQGRTALTDESFNNSVFLTCNLPPLHLANYDGFAEDWVKGRTQRLGTYKSAGEGVIVYIVYTNPEGRCAPDHHISPHQACTRNIPQESNKFL